MSPLPTGELLRRQKLTISDRALTVHTMINNNNNSNNNNNNNNNDDDADYLQFIHLKKLFRQNTIIIIQFLSF